MLYQVRQAPKKLAKRATQMIMAASTAGLCVGVTPAMFPQAAHAAKYEEVRTKIVRYGDLNIASAKGQEALAQRIRRAAKQVCDVVGTASILERRKIRNCVDAAHSEAWAIAQQRIGNYRLAVKGRN